jgi:hypothetical protein
MDILKNLMLGIVVLVVISVATIGIMNYQCYKTMVVLGIKFKEGDEACAVVYKYNKEQRDIREYQRLKEKYN